MKIALLQFDNRPIQQLGAMAFLLHRNQTYAARHGYDFLFLDRAYYDLPVYWQKPKLVRHFLSTGYDLVAWLDTDAVVHDLDQRIENLFQGDEQMVAAADNPHWDQPFNAGVFFAKAGAIDVMDRWSALFDGARWTRNETAWICEEDWAGPAYEQGAFKLHLLNEMRASGRLRLLDWHVLQSPFPMDGAFTVHFAGPFRANLPAYLRLI